MVDEIEHRARALLNQSLVWDNHACMPLRPGDGSYLDQLERAHRSGVDVICLNIGFGPLSLNEHLQVLAWFRTWLDRRRDQFVLARRLEDIDSARAEGKLAVIFDIEGMAPLDNGDHGLVEMFRDLGVSWMLVAYNRNNAAGGGCMDKDPGLSVHGRRILREMKRVGMIVCCSHTGQRTACDVFEAADNPVIFSHSNAGAVHQHVRNISDDLIKACAATRGVVGVNGVGDFLGSGTDYADLIVRHVDHMVELVGSEHVGLSLDYVYDQQEVTDYIQSMRETFGDEPAAEFSCRFAPPETFVPIVTRLIKLGYADKDIRNIVGCNWRRIARQVWK